MCFLIKFKSGYWESDGNSIEEIINWNSKLLTKKFQLGYDEHVKNDYKQVLLKSRGPQRTSTILDVREEQYNVTSDNT